VKLIALIATLAIAGCASTSALQTFEDVYQAAVTADDLAVQSATTALNAGLISSAQAASIQTITTDAMNLLTAANTAFQAGDSLTANKNVAAASATLIALSLCLTQKPLTVASFAACAANVPPLTGSQT